MRVCKSMYGYVQIKPNMDRIRPRNESDSLILVYFLVASSKQEQSMLC